MKVYVAGSWQDRELIGEYIDKIHQTTDHKVTADWTRHESHDTLEERFKYSQFDINGVKDADVLLILITNSNYIYKGTCSELGAALALNKPVIVWFSVDNVLFRDNIFLSHPLVHFAKDWNDVVQSIKTVKSVPSVQLNV